MRLLVNLNYSVGIWAMLTLTLSSCNNNDKNFFDIDDIYQKSFNDTIFNVYKAKEKGKLLVVTKLKSSDTLLRINGVDSKLNYFSSFADLGLKKWQYPNLSILRKTENSDSFYIFNGVTKNWFELVK